MDLGSRINEAEQRERNILLDSPFLNATVAVLTINVPVVFMARQVMVLRGATFGPKKVEIFRAHPFQCPE